MCAWCEKIYNGREWFEPKPEQRPADPVSHGICDACRARIEDGDVGMLRAANIDTRATPPASIRRHLGPAPIDSDPGELRIANGGTGATPGFGFFGEPECLGELKNPFDDTRDTEESDDGASYKKGRRLAPFWFLPCWLRPW